MKTANLLLLSPFFYPDAISTGKYNSVLVQALVDCGVTVTVVCSHPFYPAWRPVRSADRLESVAIHRGGAWLRYPRSMILRRMVLEAWFALHAGWTTWRLRDGCSTAVAVFPPTLFFLIVIGLLPASAKKVGIVHDLQGVLGLSGGGWLKRALYRAVHAVEKRAFRSCDTLIVLSQSMAASSFPGSTSICFPMVRYSKNSARGIWPTQRTGSVSTDWSARPIWRNSTQGRMYSWFPNWSRPQRPVCLRSCLISSLWDAPFLQFARRSQNCPIYSGKPPAVSLPTPGIWMC